MTEGQAAEGSLESVGVDDRDAEPIQATLVQPVTYREVAAITLWTIAADLLIFRTLGLSGPGLFFALTPILFLIACPDLPRGPWWKVITATMGIVALRLVWSGTGLGVFSGLVLVAALAMSAAGCVPLVMEAIVLFFRAAYDGFVRLVAHQVRRRLNHPEAKSRTHSWLLTIVTPAAAALVFGSIFVFANPNLFDWVSIQVNEWSERFQQWLADFSIWEIPFCVLALLMGAGLMRPAIPLLRIGPADTEDSVIRTELRSPFYAAVRNTLWTLIALFAVYLAFEFVTLWKREFPEGFYYAGYAHEGAAWLTFALALATALLSLAFSGTMLQDDRLASLRRLAWIWSVENLILALAVYNRLAIYVGYNGMTRMRTVGFFGTTLVVVGFCLVVYKIAQNRSFWWLLRAQLTALMLSVIVFSISPIDYVAHRYNARVINAGYLHPSVMIAVKPTSDEGVLPMLRLTQCEDKIIREGVLALLAERQIAIKETPLTHWTEFQGARELLKRRLAEQESEWSRFLQDDDLRADAIESFRDYAMQWY